MILKEYVHGFRELGSLSIEQAKMECFEDFYDNVCRFAGRNADNNECSIENYARFNSFCGVLTNYNNKNVQFTIMISRENSTDLFFNRCESNNRCADSLEDHRPKDIDTEDKERGERKLCEDVEIKHFGDSTQIIPRYKAIFAPGEFPHLIFKIARIGNKDYFWYVLSR